MADIAELNLSGGIMGLVAVLLVSPAPQPGAAPWFWVGAAVCVALLVGTIVVVRSFPVGGLCFLLGTGLALATRFFGSSWDPAFAALLPWAGFALPAVVAIAAVTVTSAVGSVATARGRARAAAAHNLAAVQDYLIAEDATVRARAIERARALGPDPGELLALLEDPAAPRAARAEIVGLLLEDPDRAVPALLDIYAGAGRLLDDERTDERVQLALAERLDWASDPELRRATVRRAQNWGKVDPLFRWLVARDRQAASELAREVFRYGALSGELVVVLDDPETLIRDALGHYREYPDPEGQRALPSLIGAAGLLEPERGVPLLTEIVRSLDAARDRFADIRIWDIMAVAERGLDAWLEASPAAVAAFAAALESRLDEPLMDGNRRERARTLLARIGAAAADRGAS